jgi:hypothetical protein
MVLEGDGEWTLVEKKRTKRKPGPRLLGKSNMDTTPPRPPRPPKQSKNPPKDQDSVAIGNHFDILNGE